MINIRRSISTLIVRGEAGITQEMIENEHIQGMIKAGGARGGKMTGREGGVAAGSTVIVIHPGLGRVEARIDEKRDHHLLNHEHLIGSLGHPHKIKRRKCQLLIYLQSILE